MPESGPGGARARPVMDPAETFRRQVPVSTLKSFLTPTESVYVIAHMGIAHVAAQTWELRIEGAIERPVRLSYEELLRRPAETIEGVLECFGNPVEPDAPTRRVGNVSWRGTRLWPLLEGAGLEPRAQLVWLEAPDHGTFAGTTSDHYVKDIPLEIVRDRPVLLAWEMNGAPLTAEHGFPVRAVVPGFFGTNSVKWVTRVYRGAARESLHHASLQPPDHGRRAGADRARAGPRRPRADRRARGGRCPGARGAERGRLGVERGCRAARGRQHRRRRQLAGSAARASPAGLHVAAILPRVDAREARRLRPPVSRER